MDEQYFCLACGKPRPKPKKDVTRDHFGRAMTFCNQGCKDTYDKRKPRA